MGDLIAAGGEAVSEVTFSRIHSASEESPIVIEISEDGGKAGGGCLADSLSRRGR